AFSVGLFANAVLPGRIGELARVAVLTRKVPRRKGLWATLVGTVLAHRVFDIVPVMLLILYVLVTAKVPAWAITILVAVVGIGLGLFTFAIVSARTDHGSRLDGLGAARRVVAMARARAASPTGSGSRRSRRRSESESGSSSSRARGSRSRC